MSFLDILILRRKQLNATKELAGEAYIRAERLEIDLKAAQARILALEHDLHSLTMTVRGRLGGRPRKLTNGSAGVPTPLPLGAQIFPPGSDT